jgi:hypothetical protein
MAKAKSLFRITGKVTVYSYPADKIKSYHDHVLIGEGWAFPSVHYARCMENGWIKDIGDILVVNAGLNQIILLLNGGSTTSFGFCGVGSDGTIVTPTDTDLNTPITRIAVTYIYQSANVGHWDTFFNAATGNGTWLETCLASALSGGIMLCRKVITSFVKSSSNTGTISWQITVTAV